MGAPRPDGPADIFLSYAREDRECAAQLAEALSACGWRVWWDRDIDVGADFGALIESNLQEARAVVVLWSVHSVKSSFVRDEAGRARDAAKLHPVRIAEVDLPIGFGQIQTFDLVGCDTSGTAFDSLTDQLTRAMARDGVAQAPRPRPRRRVSRTALWIGVAVSLGAMAAAVAVWFAVRSWRCNASYQVTMSGVDRLQNGDTDQAIDELTRAIEMCDSRGLPYRYRGEAYARMNDYDLAAADLQRALALGLEGRGTKRVKALLVTIADAERKSAAPAPATEHVSGPSQPQTTGTPPAPPPPVVEGGRPAGSTAGGGGEPHPGGAPGPVQGIPVPDSDTQAAVFTMFSQDKDARIEATTSLVVDARRAAAAVPLATKTATEQADNESGVINTLVLLQSAGPAALKQNRAAIEALLARAAQNGPQSAELAGKVRAAMDPLVYIQIGSEAQRPLVERLRKDLQARGFDAPGIENVTKKNLAIPASVPEVRVLGSSGRGAAQIVASAMKALGLPTPRILPVSRATPPRDTYEVWIDRATCADRQVNACI